MKRLATLFVMGFCLPAAGEVRTWQMEGTVTTLNEHYGAIPFIHPGDRIAYTFTFDSDTRDTNGGPPASCYHGTSSSLRIGSEILNAGPPNIWIQKNVGGDLVMVYTNQLASPNNQFTTGALNFDLRNPSTGSLLDTRLPNEPYDLNLFQDRGFSVNYGLPPDGYYMVNFGGIIDSFYAIPEPGMVILFAIGCLVLGHRHKF